MFRFNPAAYRGAASLLTSPHTPDLKVGAPNTAARDALAALSIETLLAPHRVVDRQAAACCLAGLWLLHDFFDESHKISQDIETVEGSYWHGILHRREPDFANAKYWFRRVGKHAIGSQLAAEARELVAAERHDAATAYLSGQTEWDHYRFVDLCEAVADGRSTSAGLCRCIQLREWELLFDHCYRAACGSAAIG